MVKIPGQIVHSLRVTTPDEAFPRLNTWRSVKAEILRRIRSGMWAPGQLIPTEQDLAREMGCARATVNRAMRELADSGVIERRRKVGTRVTASPARRARLEMPLIRDEVEAAGATYGYELTSFTQMKPTDVAMKALQVEVGDDLTVIKARYTANGQPHCCEVVWLNPKVLPPLDRSMFDTQPVHEWLASYSPLTHGRFSILAEGASGDCAKNLDVEEGTPVLTIERVFWRDATPLSFARHFYPPHHRLVTEE